jgi:hypothetical protein
VGVLLAFVLAFAALMSLFTSASVEIVFVGTCTYVGYASGWQYN